MDAVKLWLTEWGARSSLADDTLAGDARLLDAIFGNSPYLSRCLLAEPAILAQFTQEGPDTLCQQILHATATWVETSDIAQLYPALRKAKRQMALTIAFADLSGLWDLHCVTAALSAFADQALDAAIAVLLRTAADKGDIVLPPTPQPWRQAGYSIIAMGKWGAHELNYSSDVDFIALYDASRLTYRGRRSPAEFYVRLTRDLVQLLQEPTEDGYVFRTDLRLRPDPASTPLALSVAAAETYYESMGLNWERAAMIKARPAAGDIATGMDFLRHITPFVWRRNLDFAAIRDIHAIKRQIHHAKGHAHIAIEGHDVKLGRGGIREIEFFAQTQQLIWGGRDPRLRVSGTCAALDILRKAGRVPEGATSSLDACYRFLRLVEHRLQMIDDHQTHRLPEHGAAIDHLARFCGFADTAIFRQQLEHCLQTVEKHYAALFEDDPEAAPIAMHLTGPVESKENLDIIRAFGFGNAEAIDQSLRGWTAGRYRATRSPRAQEILSDLIPRLLQNLGQAADPDAAFNRFDQFLQRLPAGVQILSLLASNPSLLGILAEIMGTAPALAEMLGRRPALLDVVLDIGIEQRNDDTVPFGADLDRMLINEDRLEAALDVVRRWARDRQFQSALGFLLGRSDVQAFGTQLTRVADRAIQAVSAPAIRDFAQRHGSLPGDGIAILALGKLGSGEMSIGSDLDLLFIYDGDSVPMADDIVSSGPKKLPLSEYYGRLSQRLIAAISAETGEGTLYDVDMRLRPSGNSGPIASSLASFTQYQTSDAWSWEHMALTRARVVAGPERLADRIDLAVKNILSRPRDPTRLKQDIVTMRDRVAKQYPGDDPWDVKHRRGGGMDVDFITQFLILAHAHAAPSILNPHPVAALQALHASGIIGAGDAAALTEASLLWRSVQAMHRLLAEDGTGGDGAGAAPISWPPPMQRKLAQAGHAPDLASLETKMDRTAQMIVRLYERILLS